MPRPKKVNPLPQFTAPAITQPTVQQPEQRTEVSGLTWDEFFGTHGDALIPIGEHAAIKADTFYQLVKQRLINDLRVNVRTSSNMASLTDDVG